ncbi:hypothetical protein D3C84_826910 [compost metagenome]
MRRLVSQLLLIARVPAVAADQHAQASGRGLQDLRRLIDAAVDVAAHFTVRVLLALGLAEYRAVAGKHQAAVVQGA